MSRDSPEDIREQFQIAVDRVSNWNEPIPPDTLLRLYAYYKIARSEEPNPQPYIPLIDGFKMNALLQVRHLDPEQAMEAYLDTVRKELDRETR